MIWEIILVAHISKCLTPPTVKQRPDCGHVLLNVGGAALALDNLDVGYGHFILAQAQ